MKTILVYGLKNMIGGAETYLLSMQHQLIDEIKFVFVVEQTGDFSCTNGFIHSEQVIANGGEIEYLPERHNFKEYIKSYKLVLNNYKRYTDTLYVNVAHISFDIIPIIIAIKEGYKVVTHSHNAMQEPIKNIVYKIRQRVFHKIAVLKLRHMNVVRLAVSQRAGDYLYCDKSYTEVSPGIDVERFVYDESVRNRLRLRLNVTNNVVLGFVGRLVPVKNPLFLVDILCEIKRSVPTAKLLIVGDGDLREAMESKIKSKLLENDVVFVGAVNNVYDYYCAMDALLLPSLSEGLPFVTLEAQCVGVPCVCAKDNIPKAVDVTGCVRFCSLESGAVQWCTEITEVLSIHPNRKRMNLAVHDSDYNIKNVAKKLLGILK